MQNLLVLACPIGMGLMMWFMGRGMRDKPATPSTIEALRDEHRRLGDELERLESEAPEEKLQRVS